MKSMSTFRGRPGRIARAMIAVAMAVLLAPIVAAFAAPEGAGRVLAVRLEGPVTPVMAEVLEHAIVRAADVPLGSLITTGDPRQ